MRAPDRHLSLPETGTALNCAMATDFRAVYRRHLDREAAQIKRVCLASLLAIGVTGTAMVWIISALPMATPPLPNSLPPAAIAIDLASEPASVTTAFQPLPPGPPQILPPQLPSIKTPPDVMAPSSPNTLPIVAVPKKVRIQPKRKNTPPPQIPLPPVRPLETQSTATTAPPASDSPPSSISATTAKGTPSARAELKTVTSWQGALLARLEHFKRYPSLAQSEREEGTVMLRFTMDREGHVLTANLAHKTGYDLLDDETLALIRRAEPLPNPPDTIKGTMITLTVPVEFYVNER